MRGFLSFIILWFLSFKEMSGKEIAEKIREIKGKKPSPGTIYPALKELKRCRFIKVEKKNREKFYSLTQKGKKELTEKTKIVRKIFGPICSCTI